MALGRRGRSFHLREAWGSSHTEKLREATAFTDRIVYLEGPSDPVVRVEGFCPVAEETVALGVNPGPQPVHSVRLTEAARCDASRDAAHFLRAFATSGPPGLPRDLVRP